jgi:hypothetical protein
MGSVSQIKSDTNSNDTNVHTGHLKKDLCQHFALCRVSILGASSTECLCSLRPDNQIDTYRERELFSIILTTTTTSTGRPLGVKRALLSYLRWSISRLLFLKIV